MKKIFCLVSILLFSCPIFSQQHESEFGRVTQSDIDFKIYQKDTTAKAIVLHEIGDFKFELIGNHVYLIKEYLIKVKILSDKGFEHANIDIPYFHNDERTENVYDIRGITHNNAQKTGLTQNKIYTVDNGENWSLKRFTLPNIKEGSIIQYTYKIKSPFFFNLDGWDFQSTIPKLYSEFNAKIPGNYFYNRTLIGGIKLDLEETSIKKDCFYVGGGYGSADCEVIKYAMEDIPAFSDEEEYMLATSNYMARLDFELAVFHSFNGTKKEYTKTWKDVDTEFKKDRDIGRQLAKNHFAEKNIPHHLLNEGDQLTRAKNIYQFVKDHFTWNGKYGIYKDTRVKEAFNAKKGDVGEINISLINFLKAAGIKVNLMMLATRNRKLPKRVQPVINDFNYVIARAEIDGKVYLLDATNKSNPFGMLPFRCLNHYGRVMDFQEASYWHKIQPEKKNRVSFWGTANIDPFAGEIKGKIREINQGYKAVSKYETLASISEEEYLDRFENSLSGFYINEYAFEKKLSDDKKTTQTYDFSIETDHSTGNIYLNPVLIHFFKTNPFLSETRNFPVDFGYPSQYEYNMSFYVPETHEIKERPKNQAIALPENLGIIQLTSSVTGQKLVVRYVLQLKGTHFSPEFYLNLKKFFEIAVDIERNSLVKISPKEN